MKTAIELLGYEDMRIPEGFGITDLEFVAQRAREEMRGECLKAFREQCRIFDNGSDSVPSLTEECIDEALSELPVK